MRKPSLGYIYTRSSKDRNDVSCSSQKHELEEQAEKLGIKIIDTFEDKRLSSTKDSLPARERMLHELSKPDNEVKHILVHHPSRLGRDLASTSELLKRIRIELGVKLHFLHLPEPGSPESDLFLNMMMSFDQYHSQISSAGARRGQRENLRNGYRAGGRPPYGYMAQKELLGTRPDGTPIYKSKNVPDPNTAPIFKEWVRRKVLEESTGSIFDDFNKRGIPAPSGKGRWKPNTASYWIQNIETYRGYLIGGKNRTHLKNGKHIPGPRFNPEEEWIVQPNAHVPLITEAEFQYFRKLRNKNKRRRDVTTAGNRKNVFPLRGVLTCGLCGGILHGDRNYYRCEGSKSGCANGSIHRKAIEEPVIAAVLEEFLNEDFFKKAVSQLEKRLKSNKSEADREADRVTNSIAAIDSEIDRIFDLYANEKISSDQVAQQIHKRQERQSELQDQLDRLKEQAKGQQIPKVTPELLKKAADDFYRKASSCSPIKLKHLFKTIFERIELGPKIGNQNVWKRKVRLSAYLDSLTRDKMASPTGFEPVSPA